MLVFSKVIYSFHPILLVTIVIILERGGKKILQSTDFCFLVGLKYAQSLFSKLDNVFKNSVENGSDVKLTITNENLPLPLDITIKKGKNITQPFL